MTSTPLPPTTRGCFVRSTDNDLGIGKIRARVGDTVRIEYFDSISADGREEHSVAASSVLRMRIQPQVRCYLEKDGHWQIGRAQELLDHRYCILLPNGHFVLLPESDFYVRWARPLRDPVDVMIANGMETPLFYAVRRPFLATMLSQYAACHGMTSLPSAVVTPYSHQVDVASRVIMDPRQRYLLADEVGLGKTIEAGYIIRQRLLDDPTARVVVAVPRLLVRQWQRELSYKFLVDDFTAGEVSVIPHEALADMPPGQRIDMLVVDEAHHLMPRDERDLPESAPLYPTLRRLAATAPALLLLSATPLLHNELAFLAMLHLLDPLAYRLEDVDTFRRRVQERQDLARRLQALRPGAPGFLLRRHVDALRTTFPSDSLLTTLLDAISALLSEATPQPELIASAIASVRSHVSETYRLNRRVLRNRRDSASTVSFQVRGRAGLVPETVSEEGHLAIDDWLDEWRDQLRADHRGSTISATVLRTVLECAGSDHTVLEAAIRARLRSGHPTDDDLISENQRADLQLCPPTDAEHSLLNSMLRRLEETQIGSSRLDHVVNILGEMPAHQRAVVFTFSTGLARRVATALVDEYGKGSVARHIAGQGAAEVENEVGRFVDGEGCQFLVCDATAEEGRNLQAADRIIHLDLPWSPNRIEQRLGRVDRHGPGAPVVSTVFVTGGGETSYADTWIQCLMLGFRVFSSSIASLQHVVDAQLQSITTGVLEGGIFTLRDATARLADVLDEERSQVADLEELESISGPGEFSQMVFRQLQDAEEQWQLAQGATENWLCDQPGNLRFHRETLGPGVRQYLACSPRKDPRPETLPLIAWDILQRDFRPLLGRRGSYSRSVAMSAPGSRLFRVGEPFVDAVVAFSRSDTRGQVYGAWRHRREWRDEPELVAFKFDFIVTADITTALQLLEGDRTVVTRRVLQRRVDAFFPPLLHSTWIELKGQAISDPHILRMLNSAHDPAARDFNLSATRRWALDRLVPIGWEAMCRRARETGEEVAVQALDLRHRAEGAALETRAAFDTLQRREQLRRASGYMGSEGDDFTITNAVADALVDGVLHPLLTVDSIGCVVLAGYTPSGPGFGP